MKTPWAGAETQPSILEGGETAFKEKRQWSKFGGRTEHSYRLWILVGLAQEINWKFTC